MVESINYDLGYIPPNTRWGEGKHEYHIGNAGYAFEAIKDTGIAMNHAIVAEGDLYTTVLYQGVYFGTNPEAAISIPEDRREREEFIFGIFKPFLLSEDKVHRSLVSLIDLDKERSKDIWGQEGVSHLTMALRFPKHATFEINRILKGQADYFRKGKTTHYFLD